MAERYKGAGMDSREMERQIDAVFKRYAAVEPRAGLEERILANVRAERVKIAGHAWWKWGLVAAGLILAAGAWRLETLHHAAIAQRTEAMPQSTRPLQKPATTAEANAQNPHIHPAVRRKVVRALRARMQADPKLGVFPSPQPLSPDVFPSPRPLSEEELALARYVWNFPGDAKLVAQAQESSANEVMQKMQVLAKESTESN